MPIESAELHLEDSRFGDLVFDAVRAGPDDGEPVLLLHGWPQTSLSWHGVMASLAAQGGSVVAVDQRGYSEGARPGETSAYELPHLLADAAGFVAALGWDSAHVVGHDWGAVVAWALAARSPELVRSLVAVSVPHPQAFRRAMTSDPVQATKAAYLAFFHTAPATAARVLLRDGASRLRAVYAGDVAEVDVDRYVEHFGHDDALLDSLRWYAAMEGDHFRGIGPVQVRTTYVWGSEDVAIGETAARRCAEWCTGPYELVVLEGRGHWLPDTDPDAIVASVLAHLPAGAS